MTADAFHFRQLRHIPQVHIDAHHLLESAAVLFEDAADDRETKPGALFPCRDIGLEQPVAVFFRQARPVVHHVDQDVAAVPGGANQDAALAELLGRHRGDRFGRVLDDVGESLRDQPPVKAR